MRIIVVEDEAFARRSLVKLIGQISERYIVAGEARNGDDAVALIDSVHPDFMLTDIRMPGMDGLALLGELRRRGSRLAAAIISGYSDFNYAQQAIHYGVEEYIVKPFTYQDIADCLNRVNARLENTYRVEPGEQDPAIISVLPHLQTEHLLVRKALNIVEDNMGKSCALGEVAQVLGVSGEHLSRVFHAETGFTFSNYVTLAKIDNAMSLMRNSSLKTSEIAQLSGYQNPRYFYRVFKGVTGLSTSEYLALCRRN